MKATFADPGRKIRCAACGSLLPEADTSQRQLCPNCAAERARKSQKAKLPAPPPPPTARKAVARKAVARKNAAMTRGEFYLQHQALFVVVVILSIALSVGGLIVGGALGSITGVAIGAFVYVTGPWLVLSHQDRPAPPKHRRY